MLFLSEAELQRLTDYKRPAEQRTVLDELGIPWKDVRGRTIVLSRHVEAWAEGKPVRASTGPRLDLVR